MNYFNTNNLMQQSNTFIDVQFNQQFKNNSKQHQICTIDENSQIGSINVVKVYNTDKFDSNTTKPLKKLDIELKSQEMPLNQVNHSPSYWNLSDCKQIKGVELITKTINDYSMNFKLPVKNQIIHVYYHIQIREDKIVALWYYADMQGNDMDLTDTIKDGNFEPFLNLIQDLNMTYSAVFMIGFQMSSGVYIINNIDQTLMQIPIYRFFKQTLDFFKPNIKFGVKLFNTNSGVQITNIFAHDFQIQKVYFIDSCQIAYEQVSKDQKQHLDSYCLNNFIDIYSDSTSLITLFTAERDQEESSKQFNKWRIVFESNNLLQSRLNLVGMLNVPLSFALFQTISTCIRTYLFRQFFEQKWLFMYQLNDDVYDEDNDQNGGIFEIVNPDFKFKAIPYVFEGDYFSLYPTIILAFNISPETVIDSNQVDILDKCYKKQINYKSGQSDKDQATLKSGQSDEDQATLKSGQSDQATFKYAYFLKESEQVGIIPALVSKLLSLRKAIGKSDTQYKTLKLILATIYGVVGMKQFSLFNSTCQKAICSLGRKACDVAMVTLQDSLNDKQCVIARYTDSCQFRLNMEGSKAFFKIKKLNEEWPNIQKKIQNKMDSTAFEFQLEDNMSIIKMYLAQINSSISIQAKRPVSAEDSKGLTVKNIDINKLFLKTQTGQGKDYLFSLHVKGHIHWYKYSMFIRANINFMLIKILTEAALNPDNSITEIVQKQVIERSQLIEKCIQFIKGTTKTLDIQIGSVKWQSLKSDNQQRLQCLQSLATLCKFSNKDNTSQYMQQMHKINTSCYILPFIDSSGISARLVSMSYIPFNEISIQTLESVDFNSLKHLLDLVFVLFDIQSSVISSVSQIQPYLIKNETLDQEHCQIRIEEWRSNGQSSGKKSICFMILPINDLYQFVISNKMKSVHEIIGNRINKLYFDIEKTFTLEEFEQLQHEKYQQDFSPKLLELQITQDNQFTERIDYIIRTQVQEIVRQLIGYNLQFNRNIQINMATAHKRYPDKFKYSVHCVVNVACTKQTNYFMAIILNKILQVHLNISDIVDRGIYSRNSSLRLPLSIKIDNNGGIDDRKLIYNKSLTFDDFIISDISADKCAYIFTNDIIFDNRPPINIIMHSDRLSDDLVKYALEKIKQETKRLWEISSIKQGIVTFKCTQTYKCLVCKRSHTSDSMYGIQKYNVLSVNCYSNKLRQHNVHDPISFSLAVQDEIQQEDSIKVQDQSKKQINFKFFEQRISLIQKEEYKDLSIQIQDNRYVKYDLDNPTTYIISGMGSGKSAQLALLIAEQIQTPLSSKKSTSDPQFQLKYKTIICLSFRITFTTEFAKKYDLVSYQDIRGQISLNKHPKLIIQVDSLFRIQNREAPDLLIIDEVESILEKIESSGNQFANIFGFNQLLRDAKRVVIMDGLMEPRTIEYLNTIRNTDNFKIIYNKFVSRSDYILILYQFHDTQYEFVVQMFIDKLLEGKKIYGMITQKKLGLFIMNQITEKTGKRCIFYNGDNLKFDDALISHKQQKDEHFKDVDSYWQQYDVVLHSSTVTAGVSFNIVDYFDIQINVLSVNTCSAVSFIQGCHRVRSLKDKEIHTFIEPINHKGDHSLHDHTFKFYEFNSEHFNSKIDTDVQIQMQTWLYIRKAMSTNCMVDLIIKYAKSMGYNIKAQMIPEQKGAKLSIDKHIASKIADVILPSVSEEINNLDKQDQQYAIMKLSLMFDYQLKDIINDISAQGIKYLIKEQYTQKFRIQHICHLEIVLEKDQFFWKHKDNWLADVRYKGNYSVQLQTYSQTIMKAKSLLLFTTNGNIAIESFEQQCVQLKIDINVLNEINVLRIPVKSPKGIVLNMLTKILIALMKICCYKHSFDGGIVKFTRFSIYDYITVNTQQSGGIDSDSE